VTGGIVVHRLGLDFSDLPLPIATGDDHEQQADHDEGDDHDDHDQDCGHLNSSSQ